jgi:hypothetical protein
MCRPCMQLEITPALRKVVTGLVRAIEPKQNQRLLLHILRLEYDARFHISMGHGTLGDIVGGVRCIRRGCEDDNVLLFLHSSKTNY